MFNKFRQQRYGCWSNVNQENLYVRAGLVLIITIFWSEIAFFKDNAL